jgi:hypothetical protein
VASETAQQGDTVIMLSSELIAEVMEQYFNKAMFKKKVKITDLKPTEQGYAFGLAFVDKEADKQFDEAARQVYEEIEAREQRIAEDVLTHAYNVQVNGQQAVRDNKGRFVKQR